MSILFFELRIILELGGQVIFWLLTIVALWAVWKRVSSPWLLLALCMISGVSLGLSYVPVSNLVYLVALGRWVPWAVSLLFVLTAFKLFRSGGFGEIVPALRATLVTVLFIVGVLPVLLLVGFSTVMGSDTVLGIVPSPGGQYVIHAREVNAGALGGGTSVHIREAMVPGVLSRDWLVFHGEWNERWNLDWQDEDTFLIDGEAYTMDGLKSGMYVIIGD
ncbi:MAG: hypothetical protein FH749_10675 [Firmicutes bacterium]|nr:hypothetical protein [Bacillota bacterium]